MSTGFKLISRGERYENDVRTSVFDVRNRIELHYVATYEFSGITAHDSLAKDVETGNSLIVTLSIPKTDFKNPSVRNLMAWAKLPVSHDDHHRDLAVNMQAEGDNHRTVILSHASITYTITDNPQLDFVTMTLTATQKLDQLHAVVIGTELESTYELTRERVLLGSQPMFGFGIGAGLIGMSGGLNLNVSQAQQNLQARIRIISIDVFEDMLNHPQRSFPNCNFRIRYEVLERISATQSVRISWRKVPSETCNLSLNRWAYTCKRSVGIHNEFIRYNKIRNDDITNGNYGSIDIDIEYGATSRDRETVNFGRLALRETGRPTAFRIRYEHVDNTVPSERGGFSPGIIRPPTVTSSQLNTIRRTIETGRRPINQRVLRVAGVVAGQIFGHLDKSGTIGRASTVIDLFQALQNTQSNSVGEISSTYRMVKVRKWAQYWDMSERRWANAYFVENAFSDETLKVSEQLNRTLQWPRGTLISFIRYLAPGYNTLNAENLGNDGDEHRRWLLMRWRANRLAGFVSNEGIPGYEVIVSRYLSDNPALSDAAVNSSDVAHRLYEIDVRIHNHQNPNDMDVIEPSGIPGLPDIPANSFNQVQLRW